MKPPEEIKKGLECCVARWAATHFASCKSDCPYWGEGVWCKNVMHSDVSTYITQLESDNESKQKRISELESRLAQVERERDAAVADLTDDGDCHYCKNIDLSDSCGCGNCCTCENDECPCCKCDRGNDHFEWRGVCEENTKEDEEC